jgi:hypothetical protein
MNDNPEEEPSEDDLELTEPEIENEIADSDEWMQKGFRDRDPEEGSERDLRE